MFNQKNITMHILLFNNSHKVTIDQQKYYINYFCIQSNNMIALCLIRKYAQKCLCVCVCVCARVCARVCVCVGGGGRLRFENL